jgi:hypothetical protein
MKKAMLYCVQVISPLLNTLAFSSRIRREAALDGWCNFWKITEFRPSIVNLSREIKSRFEMKDFQNQPFSKNRCLTDEKRLKEERGERLSRIGNAYDPAYSMRERKMDIAHRARGDRQGRTYSLSIALSTRAVVLTLLIIAAGVGACGNTERSRAAAL